MRNHHAPGEKWRAAKISFPQGRYAGDTYAESQGQAQQRQNPDMTGAQHENGCKSDHRDGGRYDKPFDHSPRPVFFPARHWYGGHANDKQQRQRPRGAVEIRRSHRKLHTCYSFDATRIERAAKTESQSTRQKEMVEEEG